jgi:hypothetical protein
MDAPDNTGKAKTPKQATGTNDNMAMAATSASTDRPFGPDGATILATEHWSLLGTRSLIWNEAMSRTTVFLTVLSASIVALALLADATGFGRRTTAVAGPATTSSTTSTRPAGTGPRRRPEDPGIRPVETRCRELHRRWRRETRARGGVGS